MQVTKKLKCYQGNGETLDSINEGIHLHQRPPDYTLATWHETHFIVNRHNIPQILSVDKSREVANICECKLNKDQIFDMSRNHNVTQYIDDSNSIVAFSNTIDAENYLTLYLLILNNYTINYKMKYAIMCTFITPSNIHPCTLSSTSLITTLA